MKILREEAEFGILYETSTLRFTIVPKHPKPHYDLLLPALSAPCHRNDIPSAPVRVYIELTRKCNLTCSHCFVSASPRGTYGLPTEKWLELFEELRANRVIDLRFTGGEVTSRPDWFVLIGAAKKMGFVISVNTNGVYDEPDRVISHFEALAPEQVTLSIDGLQDSHDQIRGSGTFLKTLAALRTMHARGIRTRVNCVLNSNNAKDVPGLLKLVAANVDEINFFYMRPVGRARGMIDSMIAFDDYLVSAVQTLSSAHDFSEIRVMHREQAISDRAFSSTTASNQKTEHLPSCITTMNISCDGRYWPHGYNTYQHNSLAFGKFPDDRLQEAWAGSPRIEAFRAWQSSLLERCHRCSLFRKECPGANIEMEIAAQLGTIPKNPYCVSIEPAPVFAMGMPKAISL